MAVGDLERLETFLNAGIDVNSLNGEGVSILCFAIKNGNSLAVSKILDYSPDLTINPPPAPQVERVRDWRIVPLVTIAFIFLIEATLKIGHTVASENLKPILADVQGFGAFPFLFKMLPYNVFEKGIWCAVEMTIILMVSLVLLKVGASSESPTFRFLCHEGMQWSVRGWIFRTALFYVFHRTIYLVKSGAQFLNRMKQDPKLERMRELDLGSKAVNAVLQYGGNGESMMLSLLDHGLSLVIPDLPSHRVWLWAAANGHLHVMKRLLSCGVDVNRSLPDDHTSATNTGTALCWAARGGHLEVVKLLLDHGAEVDACGDLRATPLLLAVQRFGINSSHAESVVALLLQHGANIAYRDRQGRTPLFYAVTPSGERILDLLLNAGADPNVIDEEGKLPVHHAAYLRGVGAIKHLIRAGSRVNVRDKSDSLYMFKEMLPLHYAANNEHCEAIRALIDADPSTVLVKDGNGTSALTWAIWSGGCPEAAYILIDAGSDVNDGGGEHGSPLARASVLGDVGVIRKLIDKGADVNFQDPKDGETPLFRTLYRGDVPFDGRYEMREAIELLLQNGADVKLRNLEGRNFIQEALTNPRCTPSVLRILTRTRIKDLLALQNLLTPEECSMLFSVW